MKRRLKGKITLMLIIALGLLSHELSAQHDNHHKETTDPHDDHHVHHNHLALFLGATTNFDHHSTGFTVGIDYEYRFSAMHNLLGTGILGEYIAVESGEIIAGIPLFIHPIEQLKFTAAPIMIYAEDHHTHKHELSVAGRIAVSGNFHAGKVSFGPTVCLDIGKTTALVYGMNIGFGF